MTPSSKRKSVRHTTGNPAYSGQATSTTLDWSVEDVPGADVVEHAANTKINRLRTGLVGWCLMSLLWPWSSSRRSKSHHVVITTCSTVLAVLWFPIPAYSQEAVDEGGSSVDQYARDLGLSLAQAEANIELQRSAVELNERLQHLMGDDYGGVEFVHVPEFHVRVFVPSDADS
jgi:hypothetical protein